MVIVQNTIMIPGFLECEKFYAHTLEGALESCLKENYSPAFMPQLVDARIAAGEDNPIWNDWYASGSVMITGTTKGGSEVVVFAHIPNYLNNPENIGHAKGKGLRNGAGFVPEPEFQRLLGLEGAGVFVVDYDILKNSSSGISSIAAAVNHPMIAPFLGGMERVEPYLRMHRQVYGDNIGVWHADDLASDGPLGRVLWLGLGSGGLCGHYTLDGFGRVIGVHSGGMSG